MGDFHSWANTILGVGAFAVALSVAFRRRSPEKDRDDELKWERDWGRMVFQVNTMWDSFIASGVTKGISKGMIEMNSPVRLVGGADKILESLSERLVKYREEECPDCDEKTLALNIAQKFKEELIQICAPNNIQFELGVVIAVAIAKGNGHTLTEILDEFHVVPNKPQAGGTTKPT